MSYPPPFHEVTIVYLSLHLLGRIEPDSVWNKEPKLNLCVPVHMVLLTQAKPNQSNLFQPESSKNTSQLNIVTDFTRRLQKQTHLWNTRGER